MAMHVPVHHAFTFQVRDNAGIVSADDISSSNYGSDANDLGAATAGSSAVARRIRRHLAGSSSSMNFDSFSVLRIQANDSAVVMGTESDVSMYRNDDDASMQVQAMGSLSRSVRCCANVDVSVCVRMM